MDPTLELVDLCQTFRSPDGTELEILRGVSLRVPPGSSVLISGPSGSGKSTLLHVVGLLLRAGSGSVILEGRDVATMNDLERSVYRARCVGFVFQHVHLLDNLRVVMNITEALHYARPTARRQEVRAAAVQALSDVGLRDRALHYPTTLSGGESQRAGIARALCKSPKLVLADEPTGQLDQTTATMIRDYLFKVARQARSSVIVVSHDIAMFAPFVDEHYALESGVLVPQ